MRQSLFVLCFLCLAFPLRPQGVSDAAFDRIPFEQWLAQPDQLHFKWAVRPSRPELTFHQRLISSIDVVIDGKNLEPLRDHGELLIFMQITDANGTRFQVHGSLELQKMAADIARANVYFSERAFLLPGEYKLAVALLDTKTGEHSTSQSVFRVQEKTPDFLQQAWRGLPGVEFVEDDDTSPEAWYLPKIQGRVKWAAQAAESPAILNVVLNVGLQRRAPISALENLLPALKLVAAGGAPNVITNVTVLDLGRHRPLFEQRAVRDIDWPRLKDSLKESSASSIDLHSLENRKDDAQFFVSQVRRLIRSTAGKPCVMAILSPVAFFEGQADFSPISTEDLPGCHVVYLRSHRIPTPYGNAPSRVSIGPMQGRGRGGFYPRPMSSPFDELEPTLKPLNPKVMDLFAPADWTKALAELVKALGS